jgi:hypothetical protein
LWSYTERRLPPYLSLCSQLSPSPSPSPTPDSNSGSSDSDSASNHAMPVLCPHRRPLTSSRTGMELPVGCLAFDSLKRHSHIVCYLVPAACHGLSPALSAARMRNRTFSRFGLGPGIWGWGMVRLGLATSQGDEPTKVLSSGDSFSIRFGSRRRMLRSLPFCTRSGANLARNACKAICEHEPRQ